eukprot:Skav222466  [mRNA]  locus=scaffold2163:125472:128025:- [translate_table: standard]
MFGSLYMCSASMMAQPRSSERLSCAATKRHQTNSIPALCKPGMYNSQATGNDCAVNMGLMAWTNSL